LNQTGLKTVITLMLILVTVMISGCIPELMKEKVDVTRYLEKKYGKEFEVEKVRYHYKAIGAPREIICIIHPKDDVNLKFEVSSYAGVPEKDKVYYEDYLNILWSKQMRNKLGKLLNATSSVYISHVWKNFERVNGKTINLDEALRQYRNQVDLCVICIFSLKNKNIEIKHLDGINLIIKEILRFNFNERRLFVGFYSDDVLKKIKSNLDRYSNKWGINYDLIKRNNEILYEYENYNVKPIVKLEDIMRHIKCYK
jgi:hypothetical protein